jgi:DNA-binding transcriptional MerR regulator
MKTRSDPRWTIGELGDRAALALSVDYEGPPNDRVREVPDLRTIRYYTTLGLLDRPAEMRGRTAYYGRRHLLQLVAIKRLQAKGESLTDIQGQLVGLTDAALARVARLPPASETAALPSPSSDGSTRESGRRSASFWKDRPGRLPRDRADGETRAEPPPTPPGDGNVPESLQAVRLGEDVTLLVAATRPLDDKDVREIRDAAETLIERLVTRRLIRPRE